MNENKDYYIEHMPEYHLGDIPNNYAYAINIRKIQEELDKLFGIPKEFLNDN